MKICGVIAEYNPFHNGHAYQLSRAWQLSGCDRLVVCMGGSVSQRGEVALLDKWTRARAALRHGADAVVELPAALAVRPADRFAEGGVRLLCGLGVDALSFGCETDDLSLLRSIAELMSDPPPGVAVAIRRGLDQGDSLARARCRAVGEALGLREELLRQPNLILAVEYLRALRGVRPDLPVFPVRREGSYHGDQIGPGAGASAIRAAVARGEVDRLGEAMPPDALEDLLSARAAGRCAFDARLDETLIYQLRTRPAEDLAAVVGADEGLERLVKKHAALCGTREALIAACVSRRYSAARVSRYLAAVLIGLTKDDAARCDRPRFARVLGFRRDGRDVLKALQTRASIPLVTDAMRLRDDGMFALDAAATDLRALAQTGPDTRAAGTDFTRPIVIE